ncbi:MAG TPA: hypothetical protein VJ932_06470 [Alkalispirochaeta sp.]|nr:hypothetical protein [Alkalispirochaeta sp.]
MAFSFRRTRPTGSREEFWTQLEQELGQPILASTLGRYIEGRDATGPLWGLIYITQDTLYFRHFAQSNWFSSMMSTDGEEGTVRNRNVTFEVPFQNVETVVPPIPRRGILRILQSPDRVFRLRSHTPGSADDFVFSVEGALEPFTQELQAAVGRLH